MTPEPSKNILVFIDGPYPTEEDLALAEKHKTMRFRNAREVSGSEPCALAVAVDPTFIPKGYPTEDAPAPQGPAPTLNPTAPTAPPEPPKGFIVASEE